MNTTNRRHAQRHGGKQAMTEIDTKRLRANLAKFDWLGLSETMPVARDDLRELLAVYEAWLEAPEGVVEIYRNSCEEWRYVITPHDMAGQRVRLVLSGRGEECHG